MKKQEFSYLLGLFITWRLALFLVGALSPFFLAYQPSFPYFDSLLPSFGVSQWLYSWANFDGVHYLTIAEKGYLGTGLIQAFFPVFPLLMRGTGVLINNYLVSGLLIANTAAFLTLCTWFVLLKKLLGVAQAWTGTAILLLFPTSFFLGAVYTESLFLFLVLGAFLAALNKQWWLAALAASIAAATRVIGVMLIPALLLELYLQNQEWVAGQLKLKAKGKNKNDTWLLVEKTMTRIQVNVKLFVTQSWQQTGLILLSSIGLLGYMWYLATNFNDPIYFLHVQSEFGSGRQENLVLFPQVIWRYIKILWLYRPFGLKYWAFAQEFIISITVLFGLVAGLKSVRWSYVLFGLAAWLVPTFTGTFSSMPRYVLVCFPIFIVLTQLLHDRPRAKLIYLILSGLFLVLNTILFIQGYWVA